MSAERQDDNENIEFKRTEKVKMADVGELYDPSGDGKDISQNN